MRCMPECHTHGYQELCCIIDGIVYDRFIKCHDTQDDVSEIPSMSRHSNNNIPGNVFNVHTDVSIDAKLFMCEICTNNIKHFFWHTP